MGMPAAVSFAFAFAVVVVGRLLSRDQSINSIVPGRYNSRGSVHSSCSAIAKQNLHILYSQDLAYRQPHIDQPDRLGLRLVV